jgi:pteridine reductase
VENRTADARAPRALVTGAGRRVGRAIALALGARGMRVGVHYHASAEGAHETADAIARSGGEAVLLQSDLRTPDAPDRLVADAVRALGGIDILVNSAAVMERAPIDQVTPDAWDATMALNVRAPFFCARAAAGAMTRPEARGGVIVNIADLAGLESWPAYIPHGISKAGVIHMTRALARALAPAVRVNAVAPGAVLLPDTWSEADASRIVATTPLRRLGAPADVARAVLYLVDADYVTGEVLLVDGGRSVR